jgi:hypothetical protein
MLPACYSSTTLPTTLSLINYVNINTDDDVNRNSKGHRRDTYLRGPVTEDKMGSNDIPFDG